MDKEFIGDKFNHSHIKIWKGKDRQYPIFWEEIARDRKRDEGWDCERCGHHHDPESGYCLTVHHLIPDTRINHKWNLAALCQRCHLKCQNTLDIRQETFLEHPQWLSWHIEGYKNWIESKKEAII